MALEFDGIDDYVDIGVFDMPAVAAITLIAYVNPDANNDKRIISKAVSEAVQDHVFMLGSITGDSLKFRVKTGGTTTTLEGGGGLTPGVWQWAAGIYNGSTMKLYINGVEKASMAKSGNLDQNGWNAWIGNQTPGEAITKPWDGKIADVRLYSRALSVVEMQAIAAMRGRDNIFYGLEHRWTLRGAEGVTAAGAGSVPDLIGSQHGTPSECIYRADPLIFKRRAA